MKQFIILTAIILLALSGFSQTYYIYTAKKSGYWSDNTVWTIVPRTDNVKKDKVIIPQNITITVDNNVNNIGLGTIDLEISGTLDLVANTILLLNSSSNIVLTNGKISTKFPNSGTQQIKIGTVVKYDSKLDNVKTGMVYADSFTGISPNGFVSNSTLPVIFVSFDAKKINASAIELTWSTSDEQNNSHFEIERSNDGTNWTIAGKVLPSSTTSSIHKYSFTDKLSLNGNVYYRIRQVDMDGNSMVSSIKMISSLQNTETNIYVSAKNTVTANFSKVHNGEIMIRLINMNGVIVNQQLFSNPSAKVSLNASHLNPGCYVVQVTDKTGMSAVKQVYL